MTFSEHSLLGELRIPYNINERHQLQCTCITKGGNFLSKYSQMLTKNIKKTKQINLNSNKLINSQISVSSDHMYFRQNLLIFYLYAADEKKNFFKYYFRYQNAKEKYQPMNNSLYQDSSVYSWIKRKVSFRSPKNMLDQS